MVKIIDGELVKIGDSGVLSDGRTVGNYNLLPVKILEAEGWLPLEEVKPPYDELTQMLELESTAEVDGKIVATYKTIEKPLDEVDELENLLIEEMGL